MGRRARVGRRDLVGRAGAYGAALAMAPYLLIKVTWVVGSPAGLLPVGAGFDLAGWVVLNAVTIGMAGLGIAVALALVRPWGMRIPGPPVVFVAWVGTGFLVPMLPYAIVDLLLGTPSGSGDDAGASMPAWEATLVQCSFVGMGLGLLVALPAYLRRRRPHAFAGGRRSAPWPAVAAAAVGAVWLYWAAGGTAGVAHPGERGANWHALNAVCGTWAALAAAAATLLTGRTRLVLGWLGSGSLFAWSGWKLPFTLYVAAAGRADASLPEDLAVGGSLHVAAVLSGVALLRALVRPDQAPDSSWSTPADRPDDRPSPAH
ncbi:hypothetical protein [Streptomyces luteireticuli]|uniref:hypothetical protein n=1 Tax=Streptomyces luteireticuli TaxID=173858 RepID=UPI0035577EAD